MHHCGKPERRAEGKKGIKMNLKTTAIAAAVATAIAGGAALAQQAPQPGPYDQGPSSYQQPSGQTPHAHHRHRHGILSIIQEEMSAGRLSQKEGALLVEKIKQMRVERREEREARYGAQGAPSAQPPMQQPQ
jgi:hypothetical protein